MSTPGDEKEWRLNDQEVAAESTRDSEPVATKPLEAVGTEKELEKELEVGPEKLTRKYLSRFESGVTDSSDDVVDAKSEASGKKKWYRRLNLLKRSKKPEIPGTRQVSREYHAGFLSLLTFQWMAPLMSVSKILAENLICR
jgi:ATP-binding cassette, subfamily C (CFTR/MRP), member 1